MVLCFDRDDLNDLLPGDNNLFIRKKVFAIIQNFKSSNVMKTPTQGTASSSVNNSIDRASTPISDNSLISESESESHFEIARKKRKVVSEKPEFVLYTDAEFKLVEGRKELLSSGLQQRLCQCTISNMISATQNLSNPRYPTFQEVQEVAQHLCKVYPGLMLNGNCNTFNNKMKRRLQNIRPVKKKQGSTPQRSKFYQTQLSEPISNEADENVNDLECDFLNNSKPIDSIGPNDLDNLLISKVKGVLTERPSNEGSESRHEHHLNKELDKKQPNEDTVLFYTDLLFNKRRKEIMSAKLSERFEIIKTKYPLMVSQPIQMVHEVRRLLDYSNTNFLNEVNERLTKAMDGLLYYAFSKMHLLSSELVQPAQIGEYSKLISLMPVLDHLFEKKKKDSKKKKHLIINILQDTENPEKVRQKIPVGMPSIFVEKKAGKAFVFVGSRSVLSTCDIHLGFLAFLSLFYILDVEYPKEYALSLSIMHRIIFMDNRVVENQVDTYNSVWAEITPFLPWLC